MVVVGGWLDLMILEVFSNLNDSMILSHYRSWGSGCIHYKLQVDAAWAQQARSHAAPGIYTQHSQARKEDAWG